MRVSKVCLAILYLLSVIVEVSYGGLNLQLMATMTGENEGDRFGRTVAGLGDINGDDSNDVAVGASCYDNYTGKVYIYLGSGTFDNNADFLLYGETPGSGFGSVSSAGDVNGDGYSDFIVGASGYNSQRGKAYLYFGGFSLDTIPDLTFEEPVGEYGAFGAEVSCAGDVNNDGFDDIIVSAVNNGEVYLYLGGENMDTVADAIFSEGGDLFGGSISSAGDVNGDRYDDIIIGRHNYPLFSVYLYLGGSPLDTIADYVFSGPGVTSGDVNSDGYSDVITNGGGKTCIYFGRVTMDTLPDIVITEFSGRASTGYFNKGKYADIIIGNGDSYGGLGSAWVFLGGNPMDSTSDWGVVGKYGGELGASISSAGDVNGDSTEDVIIGEPDYFFGSCIGRAYVYAGASGVEGWDQQYQLPREIELEQNYPNPFNPITQINYALPRDCEVKLEIHNILGQKVATLVDGKQKAGYKTAKWDASSFSSGIYFYRLHAGDFVQTRKMVVLK